MDVSQCQLQEEKASEGKAAKAARLLFRPPAAPMQGKDLGRDQRGGALGSCGRIVLITYGEGSQDNCIQGTVTASTAEPSGTDSHTETRNASLGERGHCHYRSVSFKLASLGSNCSFQGKQLLLACGSLAGKFKCKAII